MISVREFERLKSKVGDIKKEVARAEGALAEQMKLMKKDYGCDTLGKAKEKLDMLTKKRDKAEEKYNVEEEGFMEKWKEELEDGY